MLIRRSGRVEQGMIGDEFVPDAPAPRRAHKCAANFLSFFNSDIPIVLRHNVIRKSGIVC